MPSKKLLYWNNFSSTYVSDSKCQDIIFILNTVGVYFQGARIELWDDSCIENVYEALLETGKIEFETFPMLEIFYLLFVKIITSI